MSSSQSRASVAICAMSWRNASSSRRRPPPSSRGCVARRDVRFAGASVDEVRELIAKCEQVVVLGRELAQLLLLRQGTAKETREPYRAVRPAHGSRRGCIERRRPDVTASRRRRLARRARSARARTRSSTPTAPGTTTRCSRSCPGPFPMTVSSRSESTRPESPDGRNLAHQQVRGDLGIGVDLFPGPVGTFRVEDDVRRIDIGSGQTRVRRPGPERGHLLDLAPTPCAQVGLVILRRPLVARSRTVALGSDPRIANTSRSASREMAMRFDQARCDRFGGRCVIGHARIVTFRRPLRRRRPRGRSPRSEGIRGRDRSTSTLHRGACRRHHAERPRPEAVARRSR